MIAILLFQFLAGVALHTGGTVSEDQGFLGFKLGMTVSEALHIAGKDAHALDHVKMHSGQRVLSDTIPITSCKLSMRRSLGFDMSNKLTAVGFTYKTTPDGVRDARDCAYQWLSKLYGPPAEETIRDSTKQEIWKLGTACVSLEAKAYNPQDFFVLIYYYRPPPDQEQ